MKILSREYKKKRDYGKSINDSMIKQKDILQDILLGDEDLLRALNNSELDYKTDPYSYYNVNIFPYIKLNGIQDQKKNFILYEIEDVEQDYMNNSFNVRYITIDTIVQESDIETEDYFCNRPRQDIIRYIIDDLLLWSNNFLGSPLEKVSDTTRIIDKTYYKRESVYKMLIPMLNGTQKRNEYEEE